MNLNNPAPSFNAQPKPKRIFEESKFETTLEAFHAWVRDFDFGGMQSAIGANDDIDDTSPKADTKPRSIFDLVAVQQKQSGVEKSRFFRPMTSTPKLSNNHKRRVKSRFGF